jgi:hypothetical protein
MSVAEFEPAERDLSSIDDKLLFEKEGDGDLGLN